MWLFLDWKYKRLMKRIILFSASLLFLVTAINYSNAGYSGIPADNILSSEQSELNVSIYPNPFTGNYLTIEANRNFQSIEILDIVGKVIYFEEFESLITKASVNLNNIDRGMYIVRLKFDDKTFYTEKIIVK